MGRSNSTKRVSVGLQLALLGLASALVTDFLSGSKATAHGSLELPPSRTYLCRFLDMSDPTCAQAWAQEPQAIYDWMEVNIGDAAGRHREIIPDGQLCSAGRDKYAAFDEPGNWPSQTLEPDSEGLYNINFFATAPHAAEYFRFYLSREGFDPLVDHLQWNDLELVHDSGPIAYSELAARPHFTFRMELPGREGRYLLYMVWQRSDSPEAFYACSDVVVASSSGTGEPTPPITPPENDPGPVQDPFMPAPGLQDLEVSVNLLDDWGAGACGEGVVTNFSTDPVVWEVYVELDGIVSTHWDSIMNFSTHPHGEHSAVGQNWRVTGASWNATLQPGAQTTFGFCLDRTESAAPGEGTIPADPPIVSVDPPIEDTPPTLEGTGPPVDGDEPTAPEFDSEATDTGSRSILAAYFPEWGIYARNYQIEDVPAAELTHLIYAFADLDAGGNITLFDPYAAVEKLFPANQSVSGVADSVGAPGEIRGNFRQIELLKEKHPHLRALIAVGGWTLSRHFSSVLSTAQGREDASDSLIDFLVRYDMFDGVDFDWEYPGGGGLPENESSAQDGTYYALFLERVRQKLDTLSENTGREYQISVASPAGRDKILRFNLPGLEPSVDFFNVMAYDFHGAWESITGHLAALESDPAGLDISTTIDLYLDTGVPREKLVLGSPLYTRAWVGVASGSDGGYAEPASGAAPGSFWDQSGMYDYKDLLGRLRESENRWELYWDDNAQAAYLYNDGQGIFSSFETPGNVALKVSWARSKGLGGMMFWELSGDARADDESLISAAFQSWFAGTSFDEIVSSSSIEFDHILGGNGRFDLVTEDPPIIPDPDIDRTDPGETPDGDPSDAEEGTASPDPATDETSHPTPSVSVEVSGNRWWQGFTANLTVRNETEDNLESWIFRFRSTHRISGAPWGISISTTDLGDGMYEHQVNGDAWATSIPAGGFVQVGFNAEQGDPIGNSGPLNAEQVFDGGLLND
ncbi:glycosyl hydrolase family 18 protein [Myxococcota bacterium]|nr:glycosyl hydrolase family 18 protein [Myxococcota bacterium]